MQIMKELIINSINFKSGRFRRQCINDYTITYNKFSLDSFSDLAISIRIIRLWK